MKLLVESGDGSSEVEIIANALAMRARVDDRVYDLDVSETEPNVYLIKDRGRIYEIAVAQNGLDGSFYNVRIGVDHLEAKIIDPKRLRGVADLSGDTSGRAEVRSAMPGKVVRILVSTGQAVQKGDGIIVVEAMKMQNEMKSPKDGIVIDIKVSENDAVGAGDMLLVIE